MKKQVLAVTTSAFLLAGGVPAGNAQQGPGGMMQHPDQQQMHQPDTAQAGGEGGMMCGGMMGEHRGMGRGMMGMMRHGGMMGERGMVAMRVIFALMDADGDGTISLQEFQQAHERIFKAMDADHDGTVSFEEMLNFMQGRGTRKLPPQQ